jgi:hypothetical protein
MKSSVQLNLPATEVRTSERDRASLRNSEHEPDRFGQPEREAAQTLAAQLFDEALTAARLTNKEVAHLLDISESLVQKMRSLESRGCPSFAQMLRLPPAFHLELHRAMNRRFGFGRAAIARLLEAVGDLALVVDR